eukprot:140118-Pelagomonas_calceolata.AAC.1
MGEVKEHVFGKTRRRMHKQGPFNRRSAPLGIGQAFTVALSRMPGPEIYNKTTEINGLTVQQLLFENMGVCQTIHG